MPVGEHIEYYETRNVKIKGTYSQDKFIEETEKKPRKIMRSLKLLIKGGAGLVPGSFTISKETLQRKLIRIAKSL